MPNSAVVVPMHSHVEPTARSRAALFRHGENCWRVEPAERAGFIVDAADYFRAFRDAALQAERQILVLAWDFSSCAELMFDDPGDGAPTRLGAFLNHLVKRNRHLHVHVLNWDFPLIFAHDREIAPLYGFGWRPRRRVHLHFDNTHPLGGSHHQKVVVIDDRLAFVGGIDLTCRRWDTPEHRPDDPRRIAYGKPYPPFHDTAMLIEGAAACALGDLARDRWARATGETLPRASAARADVWPRSVPIVARDIDIAISRTAPPLGDAPAIREVEALYLDMIAAARSLIYIENQYFTFGRIADALAARLAEPAGPQIVLVVRRLSHGWLEEATMHVLRTRLLRQLKEADRHGRFGVYYPHVDGLPEGKCIDVHAKLTIVDDEIARIGSANLCNRSMGMDTECDLALAADADPAVTAAIADLRDRLLAEHLGTTIEGWRRARADHRSIHDAIVAISTGSRRLVALEVVAEPPEAVQTLAAVADPERPVSLDRLFGEMSVSHDTPTERPAWRKLAIIVLLVAALTAIWRFTPLADVVTVENVRRFAQAMSAQPWAPVAMVAAYTPACIVFFPRQLITLAGVIAFGAWLGLVYSTTGMLLAAAITYGVGRRISRETLRRIAGERLNKITEILRRRGVLAITALRAVPVAPFVLENLVAGAARVPFWQYMLGTLLGLAPGILAVTVFGREIESGLDDPGSINYGLIAGVAVAFVVATIALRKWFQRWAKEGEDER